MIVVTKKHKEAIPYARNCLFFVTTAGMDYCQARMHGTCGKRFSQLPNFPIPHFHNFS